MKSHPLRTAVVSHRRRRCVGRRNGCGDATAASVADRYGLSFVIIQHLAPDHPSNLAEILSRATMMPVGEVRDEPEVEPNRVYVIPPGRDMIIAGGKLILMPQTVTPGGTASTSSSLRSPKIAGTRR